MYKLLRSLFFLLPAEAAHYFSMNVLKWCCQIGFIKKIVKNYCKPNSAEACTVFNIRFSNKIGLGAGFDKNAKYLDELEVLGFGFVEIGTVTPLPQAGNDKPRLFRLPKDKALINRMGFNNGGVKAVAERLKKWRAGSSSLIIGGNIGKNKLTLNEEAWKDYEICFRALHAYVDYFVVNVSSPNTPGLRELQEKESLRKILTQLQSQNAGYDKPKPILLKIAPDLSISQIDDVIDLAIEINLDGLVVANTTTTREKLQTTSRQVEAIGIGGLSGWPLKNRSTGLVQYICNKTAGKIPIIASGGVFTAMDAKEKIEAGASLVQVWTGFIYEGPGIVKKIAPKLL